MSRSNRLPDDCSGIRAFMESQANRMVALCDIMGFRSLIESQPLSRVVDEYVPRLFYFLENSITHEKPAERKPTLHRLRKLDNIGVAWFSDTILLYGLDDTDESCRTVIETVGWLIVRTLFDAPRTRIRAGISYGEFHADEQRDIFLGKSIVEAHRVEAQQEWVGGALSKSAHDRVLRLQNASELLSSDWWLTQYSVPVKGSQHPQLSDLAINWTQGILDFHDLKWSDKSPEPNSDEWMQQPDVCKKWYNTRLFHRRVCRRCGIRD